MANNAVRVSNTAVVNSATTADYSVVCTANGAVRRIPIANSFVVAIQTPANSSFTCKAGQMFADNTYFYVAVANNTLKRIALESF
jgi:hypothetical protein